MDDEFGSAKCPDCGEVSDAFEIFVSHRGECPYCGAKPAAEDWVEVED